MFADSPFALVEAGKCHRAHAIVEQVFAGLEDCALGHLPSGKFTANAAWLTPARASHAADPKATLAPDLVERDFTANAPNRLWVTDLTMISTGEGAPVALRGPRRVLPPGWLRGRPPPERTPTWC